MNQEFKIRDEFITLGQLLKAANIVESGSQVKGFLAEIKVLVNGEPDDRRGRKLRNGDVVKIPRRQAIQIIGGPSPNPISAD